MKKGFTLLEILVAIGIVSVLMGVGVSSYSTAQKKSRDAKRKSDIKQIQKALELEVNDSQDGTYRAALPAAGAAWISTSGTVYMNKVPADPVGGSYTYQYTRNATNSRKYTLCGCLENTADAEGQTCPSACTCPNLCYYVNEP